MERARSTKEDGKRLLDAESMFKILQLVHERLESNMT